MLTNLDYRAAIFQAFRAARFNNHMSPPEAFRYARKIIKPLPIDRQTDVIERTHLQVLHDMQNFPGIDVQSCWKVCYSLVRSNIIP